MPMALTITGLLGQVAFVHVGNQSYIPLAAVTRIRESSNTARFEIGSLEYTTTATLADAINAISAAGFTIIEGLV